MSLRLPTYPSQVTAITAGDFASGGSACSVVPNLTHYDTPFLPAISINPTQVTAITAGHFALSYLQEGTCSGGKNNRPTPLPILYDPMVVFGMDTSLTHPSEDFWTQPLADLMKRKQVCTIGSHGWRINRRTMMWRCIWATLCGRIVCSVWIHHTNTPKR